MKATICLVLLLTISSALTFYHSRPSRGVVKGLVDKISRAVVNNQPITFDIDNESKESLCVNYSAEEECIGVGFIDNVNFPKLKQAFGQLEEIPYCRVYNNYYGCDLCEGGRGFNGNECAPCTIRSTLRGQETKHECEYPWKDLVSQSLYSGSGNQRRSGNGYIYKLCYSRRNSQSWDGCLRAKSHRMTPIPRQMSPGSNPRRGINYIKQRGFWMDMPFNKRICNAYSALRIPWCNCKSTNGRYTCNDCDDEFLLKGYIAGSQSSRYDNSMDVDTSIYSGYMCVLKKEAGQGCKVLRHNLDQGEDHACLVCDYNGGFRMSKDGYCTQ